ncbi:MAG: LytR/AlgR family response regulator transcription factor [Chitinophagales bacterium]
MLQCIIIDDEPIARRGLEEYINEVEFLHLAGAYDHPLKAADILVNQPVDLIFLDIQMPKMTGLDFLKSFSKHPMIIFTTAYPQYAVDGFELDAIDYLVKPFSFERFWKAVMKAKANAEAKTESPAEGQDYFFIKADNKLVKVNYDDILFVEALQNYVAVITKDKKHITYLTFKSMEEHLQGGRFIKIHKSFIVSVAKIDSIEGNMVRVGSHELPISRSSKEEVMEKILQNKFLKR